MVMLIGKHVSHWVAGRLLIGHPMIVVIAVKSWKIRVIIHAGRHTKATSVIISQLILLNTVGLTTLHVSHWVAGSCTILMRHLVIVVIAVKSWIILRPGVAGRISRERDDSFMEGGKDLVEEGFVFLVVSVISTKIKLDLNSARDYVDFIVFVVKESSN